MDQKFLHQITLPPVGAVQCLDQFAGVELVETRDLPEGPADRDDAVNASQLVAGTKIESLLPIGGNPSGMFDDGPVHVGEPQAAVRSGADVDRAKPVVS